MVTVIGLDETYSEWKLISTNEFNTKDDDHTNNLIMKWLGSTTLLIILFIYTKILW